MGKKKKERQHQAIQYLPKEEPKNIYILTEKIEKIAKDQYVFHYQIFEIANDGTILTEPETGREEFDIGSFPIFSAYKIGLSKNKNELDIVKEKNDIEYLNILRDEKKWLAEQKEAPNSDDIKNILKSIGNVKGRFIIWYSENKLKRILIDDILLESTPNQFQIIVKDLQLKINFWYKSDVKVKTKLANEINLIYSDKNEKIIQQYSKLDFVKVLFPYLKLKGEDNSWTVKQLYKNMK